MRKNNAWIWVIAVVVIGLVVVGVVMNYSTNDKLNGQVPKMVVNDKAASKEASAEKENTESGRPLWWATNTAAWRPGEQSQEPAITPGTEPSLPENEMIPGLRTLKNFLLTILAPVGKVLWVTGGGWSFDDVGPDEAARSIGMSEQWLAFFDEEDADYDCSETDPVDGKNVCHEKGLDADGYVGWALYNTLYDESLVHDGFVYEPNKLVESLSGYCDFESADDLAGRTPSEIADSLVPGDFAIMPGRHMYVVIGHCEDGSLLVAHAAMATSTTGANGGSVQVSSANDGGTVDCDAYELAEEYMSEYSEWNERYDVLAKDTANYMNFYNYAVGPEANGVFHWQDGVLDDPDGYSEMSAEEIIADLYA